MKQQLEDCKLVLVENDKLRELLESSKREYLSIVNSDLEHKDVNRANKG